MAKLKVLYIAGWGRSGSSLIGGILGSVSGFSHIGESRYLWDRGILDNRDCGCGKRIRSCELWNGILETLPSPLELLAEEMLSIRESGIHTRHLLSEKAIHKRLRTMGHFLETVETIYKEISNTLGGRVIVDSSKFPSYAYLLGVIPSIDIHILHLVRDPRAVAFSWWKRQKPMAIGSGGPIMAKHHPIKSGLLWLEWNYIIGKVWGNDRGQYTLLRFEDFIAAPKKSLSSVMRKLGEDPEELPFIRERTAKVSTQHTVSGNPARFQRGEIPIDRHEHDARLPWFHQIGVTLVTWPLLKRFKYPIL